MMASLHRRLQVTHETLSLHRRIWIPASASLDRGISGRRACETGGLVDSPAVIACPPIYAGLNTTGAEEYVAVPSWFLLALDSCGGLPLIVLCIPVTSYPGCIGPAVPSAIRFSRASPVTGPGMWERTFSGILCIFVCARSIRDSPHVTGLRETDRYAKTVPGERRVGIWAGRKDTFCLEKYRCTCKETEPGEKACYLFPSSHFHRGMRVILSSVCSRSFVRIISSFSISPYSPANSRSPFL